MIDALCREALDMGCTDIMYMTIKYPNHPIIYLHTQPRGGDTIYVSSEKTGNFLRVKQSKCFVCLGNERGIER